jgi:RNA polymerase sigma factor (sigma-70 family)
VSALLEAPRTVDFDGLYRHHAPSVYRYTYAVLGNHADAEDVTQQTFLNAYRACARGTKPRKAEHWLLRIAHNEIRRHFRTTQRKPLEVELDEEVAEAPVARSEPMLGDVLRALQRLPASQRSALVMREFEGRSYAEIARILGMSQSALEAHTFRARRALAQELEEALTCGEAREAVVHRQDHRLPRRLGRRLKAHLQNCRACEHFETAQSRRRSLLRGLSVLPIPGSLFLARAKETAAAGLGATTVAAGGSAVGGGAAAGVGVAAKVAAVTAAAALAGGVGSGVATAPSPVASVDQAAPVPAVTPRREGRLGTSLRRARPGHPQPGAASRAIAPTSPKKGRQAKRRPIEAAVAAHSLPKSQTHGKRADGPSEKLPHGHMAATTKPKPESAPNRPRPAGGKGVAKAKIAPPKDIRVNRGAQEPKPPHGAKPTQLPKSGAEAQPKGGPSGPAEKEELAH